MQFFFTFLGFLQVMSVVCGKKFHVFPVFQCEKIAREKLQNLLGSGNCNNSASPPLYFLMSLTAAIDLAELNLKCRKRFVH